MCVEEGIGCATTSYLPTMNRLRSTTGILMESVSLSRVEFHLDPRDCAPHRFHLGARCLRLLHQVFAERAAGHGLQARDLLVDPLVALRGEVPALHQTLLLLSPCLALVHGCLRGEP